MKKIILFFLFIVIISSILILINLDFEDKEYKEIKIAVLDSGINSKNENIVFKYNVLNESFNTNDKFNHGTMVYNIINENMLKKQKFNIYDIQVLNAKGQGEIEDIYMGIKKAIDMKVDIINMSFGFNKDHKKIHGIIKKAHEKGIILISASGDTLTQNTDFPAKYEEVISIGALKEEGVPYSFGSTGKIDYYDLGVDINVKGNDGVVQSVSGSSFATALATTKISSYITKNKHLKKNMVKKVGKYTAVTYNK